MVSNFTSILGRILSRIFLKKINFQFMNGWTNFQYKITGGTEKETRFCVSPTLLVFFLNDTVLMHKWILNYCLFLSYFFVPKFNSVYTHINLYIYICVNYSYIKNMNRHADIVNNLIKSHNSIYTCVNVVLMYDTTSVQHRDASNPKSIGAS